MEELPRKVVIPAAGLGTRLLSSTKEQPKEMLPVFSKMEGGELSIKPVVQMIYEQLFDYGIREFYFIVGRNKRAIEDHFTPDHDFIEALGKKGKSHYAKELENFYRKLSLSRIVWINQPSPMGFGHAILMAKHLINETFLVHAGDTVVLPRGVSHIEQLLRAHRKSDATSTLLVRSVEDPRQFGVIYGSKDGHGVIGVSRVEEKPEKPSSRLAILPVYVFESSIFSALENTTPGKGSEIQLTDGIMKLIEQKNKVVAVELNPEDDWIDVGNPLSYWDALSVTHNKAK